MSNMPRGNQKQPIDLILAKGKKHLTKAEIEERKSTEIHTDHINVTAPEYLNEKQKEEFYRITKIREEIQHRRSKSTKNLWYSYREKNFQRATIIQLGSRSSYRKSTTLCSDRCLELHKNIRSFEIWKIQISHI